MLEKLSQTLQQKFGPSLKDQQEFEECVQAAVDATFKIIGEMMNKGYTREDFEIRSRLTADNKILFYPVLKDKFKPRS